MDLSSEGNKGESGDEEEMEVEKALESDETCDVCFVYFSSTSLGRGVNIDSTFAANVGVPERDWNRRKNNVIRQGPFRVLFEGDKICCKCRAAYRKVYKGLDRKCGKGGGLGLTSQTNRKAKLKVKESLVKAATSQSSSTDESTENASPKPSTDLVIPSSSSLEQTEEYRPIGSEQEISTGEDHDSDDDDDMESEIGKGGLDWIDFDDEDEDALLDPAWASFMVLVRATVTSSNPDKEWKEIIVKLATFLKCASYFFTRDIVINHWAYVATARYLCDCTEMEVRPPELVALQNVLIQSISLRRSLSNFDAIKTTSVARGESHILETAQAIFKEGEEWESKFDFKKSVQAFTNCGILYDILKSMDTSFTTDMTLEMDDAKWKAVFGRTHLRKNPQETLIEETVSTDVFLDDDDDDDDDDDEDNVKKCQVVDENTEPTEPDLKTDSHSHLASENVAVKKKIARGRKRKAKTTSLHSSVTRSGETKKKEKRVSSSKKSSAVTSNKSLKPVTAKQEDDAEELEVEDIFDKMISRKGIIFYRVLWRHHRIDESTWEPIDGLGNCKELVDAFEESLKKKPIAAQPNPQKRRNSNTFWNYLG